MKYYDSIYQRVEDHDLLKVNKRDNQDELPDQVVSVSGAGVISDSEYYSWDEFFTMNKIIQVL